MKKIFLNQRKLGESARPDLPASKSESNRVLIINALSGGLSALYNLSNARDTQTMQRLLATHSPELDVMDAGTTMRFLTAYHAIGKSTVIMTGTDRMQQRPIGVLVDALLQLGCSVSYLKNSGYPPLHIGSFAKQKSAQLKINGSISSQFISALLMIAPSLPLGLDIQLEGKLVSKPYMEMTVKLMRHFGADVIVKETGLHISPQRYRAATYTVESDWSAASYWYAFFALGDTRSLFLKGLRKESNQGDAKLATFMEDFGVHTSYDTEGVRLSKTDQIKPFFEADMLETPDLTQTFAVLAAAMKIPARMKGVQSLLIKETNRIEALKKELSKLGSEVNYDGETLSISRMTGWPEQLQIATYEDHRMAMAFAPLCLLHSLSFDDESVVDKSYPDFWRELENNLY